MKNSVEVKEKHSSALRKVIFSFLPHSLPPPNEGGGLGELVQSDLVKSSERWTRVEEAEDRGAGSDLDVLGLHHLGERLFHSEDGESGGGVMGPAL